MGLKRIKRLVEHLSFKKGSKAIYDDPDFGKFEVTVEQDSQPYKDNVEIKLKERPMTLRVRKDRLEPLNKDVII